MTATDSYQALLRLICLLLDVPEGNGEHRLARAHQLTRRALRRRPFRRPDYPAARRRVIRHVLTREQRPWPARLHWRLRVEPLPLGGDAARLRSELSELGPYSRAGYLLVQLDGLGRDEMLGELRVAGEERLIEGPDMVCDRIEAATGLGRKQQRELLAGADFDPGWVRATRRPRTAELLPRLGRRHLRPGLGYAAVVLLVVALTAVPLLPGRTAQPRPSDEFVTVPAGEWRSADLPNYRVWPTTGELRTDEQLVRGAVGTWYGHATGAAVTLAGGPPAAWWADRADPVQILFAGRAGGRTVVLMRQDGRLARYERYLPPDADEPSERLVISPVAATGDADSGQDGATDGVLLPLAADGDDGTRLLVPPWLTDLRVTPLDGRQPDWRPIRVDRHGRTEPLGFSGRAGCLDGFLVKGTASREGHTATEVFLYRPGATQTARTFVTRPGDPRGATTAETAKLSARGIDSPAVRRVLHSVVCDEGLFRQGFTPESVELDIVGHGNLPKRRGPASLLHLHVEYAGEDPFNATREVAAALLAGVRHDADVPGVQIIDRAHGPGSYQAVTGTAVGTWWRPAPGRWYYLVAAYPDVKRVKLSGGIDRTVGRAFTAIRGPRAGERADLPGVSVRTFKTAARPTPGPAAAP